MAILRYKLSNDLMKNLQGRFRHVVADGQVMIIGGTARALAFKTLVGIDINVNDCDYTVVGCSSFKVDHKISTHGANRVEVEHAAPHRSITDYMGSRDFTINQVAVDSKGNLFATKNMVSDLKNKVIDQVRTMTPDEAVRACRFALEYNFKLSPRVLRQVKCFGLETLKTARCWERYSHSFDLEGYCNTLLK